MLEVRDLRTVFQGDDGEFAVVLLPTDEQDRYRWHIFAYNSPLKKVQVVSLSMSEDGLFDLQDHTRLEPGSAEKCEHTTRSGRCAGATTAPTRTTWAGSAATPSGWRPRPSSSCSPSPRRGRPSRL